MNRRMMFSVLIANYNNAQYLSTALESVLCQTYQNWEIVLVDDDSTDDFFKVIEPYLGNDKIKIFCNTSNQGCGFTKKRCVSLASGKIAAFLDPDDKLHPEAISLMVYQHTTNPQAAIIHSTHYICDEFLNVKRTADYVKALPFNKPYLLLNDGSIHHFASFKIINYQKTEGISPSLKKAVDQDLYYKLEETGEVLFINQPLYYYRIHRGSISNAGNEKQASIVHYEIAIQACKRRIASIRKNKLSAKRDLRKYKAHLCKLNIFYWSRKQNYTNCVRYLLKYPFVGGMSNIVNYIKKIPTGGFPLLRKTFVSNYEIK